MSQEKPSKDKKTSRREFLGSSAALTAAAFTLSPGAYAAGNGTIKIGLIGCGGRGTGAALNAMNAGPDIKLVALADLFRDKVDAALKRVKTQKPQQVAVDADHCFVGFDAYKQLLQSGVDVVLIAPTSHFIPLHFKAAIDAGKHVFCEKPHGFDMPGIQIVKTAGEEARRKGLSVVSGLCWRYEPGVRETMNRVLDGAIGDIVAIQETYVSAPYGVHERQPDWNEMQYQLRNWYHFNWLSGDQIAQQLLHSLDKASWALGDKPPLRVWGMGGRQTCTDPKYGDQFDHQAVVFEYPNDVRVYGFTRDQTDCYRDTSDFIIGTKGRCDLLKYRIEGEKSWSYQGPKESMTDAEHKALFDSIRSGKPLNNTQYMCLSSQLAVAGQIASYSGQMIPWEKAVESKRSFALPRYGFDVEPPVKPGSDGRYPTAMQGKAEYDLWQMAD